MVKKIYNNSLFVFLDWILKKKSKGNGDQTPVNGFMLNRWLSMADPSVAQIVNATSNRWLKTKSSVLTDSNFMGEFFRIILPKINKNITYIKKTTKEKDQIDCSTIASAMELSVKEIENYNRLLAELNKPIK